ncbi:hypothetical protein Pcinc_016479 [Petrolisthes cinctipes]|uniref:Uncharacterized protein n=1 Tax=Petrolisthes cinctipes TaxID=88211 RepID=A0AAE1FR15_PETCI|nr:hypothetical protein Pcinc_023871 [Petrolisthes cinctipes]KAK3878939.1 hypothetical protein Pcinc_016479 [Petrolisthes cinctipes]
MMAKQSVTSRHVTSGVNQTAEPLKLTHRTEPRLRTTGLEAGRGKGTLSGQKITLSTKKYSDDVFAAFHFAVSKSYRTLC